MLIKTLLSKVERCKSFIYGAIRVEFVDGVEAVIIDLKPRRHSRPVCPACRQKRNMYDRLSPRLFEYLPVWPFKVFCRSAPRRVNCPEHGVKVEALPWSYGQERTTFAYQVDLARWAKRLSWKEVAHIFETSWDTVFRAVTFVVDYGLAHKSLEGVTEIGVDEIALFKGPKYLTLVYQLNAERSGGFFGVARNAGPKPCCAFSISSVKSAVLKSSVSKNTLERSGKACEQ